MHSSKWRSPSNIALVKYWGKYENQIPANPSLSFTLSNCHTETEVILDQKHSSTEYDLKVELDGEPRPDFEPKIREFLQRLGEEVDFLQGFSILVKTHNSFPHSSGIASSASGMSALSLCLLSLKEQITGNKEENFFRTASIWSRLGSGSASRSVYGGLVEWGHFAGMPQSSDEFAVPLQAEVAPVFRNFRDYVLLVETGSKSVSSTAGHDLMKDHPFAERRFLQAHQNMELLISSMIDGDLEKFGTIVESEALTLHSMMMTSQPYFILMKPDTLAAIEKIWEYRKDTGNHVYFTLDAGANIHLLFPQEIEQDVKSFVNNSLSGHLQNGNYICDHVGPGPEKLL